ncbi:HsdM family class I SAM-dependent methyltransferase [Azospirillum argentinense]
MKRKKQVGPDTDLQAEGASSENLLAARIMARALAASHPEEERIELARTFCFRVVVAWWSSFCSENDGIPLRDFPQSTKLAVLPDSAIALANTIGSALCRLDPEEAAYAIGMTYTGMLPEPYRASYGIYYTPPELTARLIDQATVAGVDWASCRVLDPACGGGAFLAPVAKRMLAALQDVTPAILIKNITARLCGYEIDPFAAWLSQVTLDAVMLPVCSKAHKALPVVVMVCDSLTRRPPRDRYDLVIGNPPYGRVTLPPEQRHNFRRSLFGHANLYGLFTDIALHHVRPGGVVAYVTPTSFLAGEYFKNLRGLLGREAPPVTVDFIAVRKGVFEGVLQETLLATYRRTRPAKPAQVFEVLPSPGEGLRVTATGSFALPSDPSEPWLLPRTQNQAHLIKRLLSMPSRLADWGYAVSTGPLVWNRHKSQLCSKPKAGRYPLIWAEALTADGQFVFRAEKKNHEPYFEPDEGDDWLITRKPCVLLQRTTAKEQSRRLIAAALPADFLAKHKAVVIENHLNMLRPIVDQPSVDPAVLAAFLNSGAADLAFRCVSGSVAVSAYELEALPLPSPKDLAELHRLVTAGARRNDIEAACARLYNEEP